MEIDGIAPSEGLPGGVRLAEAYRLLEEQRIEIDHCMTKIAPADPAWHDMWQEREDVLVGLARVVNKGPSINNRFRCVAGWGQWYSSTRRGIRPA
jgi:hypothetical protein